MTRSSTAKQPIAPVKHNKTLFSNFKSLESLSSEQDKDMMNMVSERFQTFTQLQRDEFLLSVLRLCYPADMQFLNKTIPRFHRDFVVLLPKNVAYKILCYVTPQDLVTCAQVSKKWFAAVSDGILWSRLYGLIGLQSMADVFFREKDSVKLNAKRLSNMDSWANGDFKFKSFRAHQLGILAIAFDGKYVATASADKSCRISLLKSGQCLRTFTGHEESVNAVQFDNEKVVTGSGDKTVRIWSNKGTGALQYTLTGHSNSVTCLKFVGTTLITGSADYTVKIWDLEGNETAIYGDSGVVSAVNENTPKQNIQKFSFKESDSVAVPIQPNPLHTAKINSNHKNQPVCLRTLHGHRGGIRCLDFCEGVLFSGDIHGIVKIWHIDSGNCVATLGINATAEGSPIFTIDEQRTRTSVVVAKSETLAQKDPISNISYLKNRLLIGTLSGILLLFDVSPFVCSETTINKAYEALKQWASTSNTLRLNKQFHLTYGKPQEDLKIASLPRGQWSLCGKLDEWRLMGGGSEGRCAVWNHRTGKLIYTLKGHTIEKAGGLCEVEVDNSFEVAQPDSSKEQPKVSTVFRKTIREGDNNRAITGVSFDDSFIVAGGMDGLIKVWEASG